MHPTKNDMSTSTREQVVAVLNSRLAETVDLALQAKQAHWNVKGPNFIALHKLFDEVAETMRELSDEVAERAVALGGTAEGTAPVIADRSSLPEYPLSAVNWRDHVEALSTSLSAFGKHIRADIDTTTEMGDADTADLFTQVSREVDKYLWFVEAHLQGG